MNTGYYNNETIFIFFVKSIALYQLPSSCLVVQNRNSQNERK